MKLEYRFKVLWMQNIGYYYQISTDKHKLLLMGFYFNDPLKLNSNGNTNTQHVSENYMEAIQHKFETKYLISLSYLK